MNLVERIESSGVRWHERSVVRHRPDSVDPPWRIEGRSSDPDDEGLTIRIATVVEGPTASRPQVVLSVRGDLVIEIANMTARFDCECRFRLSEGVPVPTRDDRQAFLMDTAIDYLLGYLRGALADAARSVGLSAPMIPPHETARVKELAAAEA